jgi:hypothetical protein
MTAEMAVFHCHGGEHNFILHKFSRQPRRHNHARQHSSALSRLRHAILKRRQNGAHGAGFAHNRANARAH